MLLAQYSLRNFKDHSKCCTSFTPVSSHVLHRSTGTPHVGFTSGLVPKNEQNRTELHSFATTVEWHIMVKPKLKNEVANSMVVL
jgi:hypothetical protein